jgi:monofunctional glycosyltransferase
MSSILRFAWLCLLWFFLFVAMMTVVYRVVPPVSTLMVVSSLNREGARRQWVPLNRISGNLVRAVLVSEDGRFCAHHGVDWQAARAAYKVNERKGRITHGASTITMQVAKNLFLWNGRGYVRKAFELPIALWIDLVWPKSRIIEVYLNIAEWGPNIYGAEAASRYHFGSAAAYLSPQQAALLAASLPNPQDRRAGAPSGYHNGLASTIRARMNSDPGVAYCVRR